MTETTADAQLAQRYLDYVQYEKRLAERTCTLYEQNLHTLLEWLAARRLPLLQMRDEHVRAWVRTTHGGGMSARSQPLFVLHVVQITLRKLGVGGGFAHGISARAKSPARA